jgi:hypothetical protein
VTEKQHPVLVVTHDPRLTSANDDVAVAGTDGDAENTARGNVVYPDPGLVIVTDVTTPPVMVHVAVAPEPRGTVRF